MIRRPRRPVANGIAPHTSAPHGVPAGRFRSWAGLAVVTAGIAAAAVVVPPLITPDHHRAVAPAAPVPSPSAASPASSPSAPVTPSATPSATPASFTPIAAEAEGADGILTGSAAKTDCAACHGGGRVRYIGVSSRVTVLATIPVSGRRKLTVVYEADGTRSLKVSVNNGAPRTYSVSGPGWETPRTFHFTADLPAGPLRVSLFNDESPAPDIDAVLIS
jgi:hypothetical protein